jgi:myo-inositol-1(or 4)-monophosphatase
VLRNAVGSRCRIEYKGKLDLVTDVDRRSEEVVVEFLTQQFPECGILAEERAETRASSGCRWILDPLDGTTNYAHGYPFFCVSLAFEQDGVLCWGGVYDPLREELFTAARGCGAFLNGSPIKVAATSRLDQALLCTGFPYDVHDSSENNLDHFSAFIKTAQAVRRDGSAALDLCYVGAGRFDGYWEMKLKPWDIAAGCLIVAEAGGIVSRFSGAPIDLEQGDVVAATPELHHALLAVLNRKQQAEKKYVG